VMNNSSTAILPSVYLGPIHWYSKLMSFDEVVLEHNEHYRKQTYRNRCRIVGPNGIQNLIVPIHKIENHTPLKEITIDYDGNWQRQHWQSIRSAYGNSPFFNFYADYFSPFYENQKWEKLIDFNSELLSVTLKLLKCEKKISFTEEYFPSYENDLRNSADFKTENNTSQFKRYPQVFEDRHGFISNLSIIDLLCCCGPEAKNYFQ
jgi:hypothetical protein